MGMYLLCRRIGHQQEKNKWEWEFVKCLQVFPNEINCHSNATATAAALYANEYSCKWLCKTNNFHYSHISFNNYNLLQ